MSDALREIISSMLRLTIKNTRTMLHNTLTLCNDVVKYSVFMEDKHRYHHV